MSYQMVEIVRDIYADPGGLAFRSSESHVLLLLASYYNEVEGHAFPSVETIARQTGTTIRWTREVLKGLASRNCLTKEKRRRSDGKQTSSSYVFTDEFLRQKGVAPCFVPPKPSGYTRQRRVKQDSAQGDSCFLDRVNPASPGRVKQDSLIAESCFTQIEGTERSQPERESAEVSSNGPAALFLRDDEDDAVLEAAYVWEFQNQLHREPTIEENRTLARIFRKRGFQRFTEALEAAARDGEPIKDWAATSYTGAPS